MSFVFRGTRAYMENSFRGIVPERRMRIHAARPVNANSLAFLITGNIYGSIFLSGLAIYWRALDLADSQSHKLIIMFLIFFVPVLLLFVVLNSHQMSPNFLLWVVFGLFLLATSLRMYATCQQLQTHAQAHAVAASGLLRQTEFRLQMPPSITFASRGRLQGLRLQLALLDREFDDLDYETLRALDADNAPTVSSMSEEQINALPVHKYKVTGPQSGLGALQQPSSSSSSELDISINFGSSKRISEDGLTCSVCLEQVNVGELIRSLPCLHQYHASCIDPWLRQQGTCPVCKFKVGAGWHEESHVDVSYMV